jgi:hypothetical protein
LLADVGLDPGQHDVEGVGELAELVPASGQPDPVGQRPARCHPGGLGDPVQRGEHPAGQDPATRQTEHQQEPQHRGHTRSEDAQEVGLDGKDALGVDRGDDQRALRDVAQQEQPHDGKQ